MTVLRGNAGEVATLVGVEAEVRGVESIGAGGDAAELARLAARNLGLVASVTGAVDHVSDGDRTLSIANGHELLASVTGTGCMSSARHRLLPRREAVAPARGRRGGARRVRRRRRGRGRGSPRPGQLPRQPLRRARGARPGDPLVAREGRCMRLHALVEDLEAARAAVDGGATVVQLRRKGATTDELVEAGAGFARARRHVRRQRRRRGRDPARAPTACTSGRRTRARKRALEAGLLLGLSASTRREAAVAEFRGAGYIGAGPVWATPSKPDAAAAIGLDGLREICQSVSVPVVAIGGVDACERGRLSARRGGRGRGHPGARRDLVSSPPLSELGELGLLAELERRGLVDGGRARRRRARRRARRHAGRARRGRPLPARLDVLARPGLEGRGGQSQRPRRLGRRPEALIVTLGTAGRDAARRRRRAVRGHGRDGRAGARRRHDRGRPACVLGVTAIGRSDRVPGRAGARPGDLLVVTGPLGGSGAGFRALRGGPARRPARRRAPCGRHCGSRRAAGWAGSRRRCSTSPTAWRSTPATSLAARACARSSTSTPSRAVGELADLGFGEDYELLAATRDPLDFP